MWARGIVEPAGKPVRLTTAVTLAPVIALAASLVTSNVIAAVPDATDSAFPMAGTSFAGDSCAENVSLVGAAGVGVGEVVELLLPQPATRDVKTIARAVARIGIAP